MVCAAPLHGRRWWPTVAVGTPLVLGSLVASQAGERAALRKDCVKFIEDYEFTSRPDAYAQESLAMFRTCLEELRGRTAGARRTLVGGIHYPTLITRHANGPPVLAKDMEEVARREGEERGYQARCCGRGREVDVVAGTAGTACWSGNAGRLEHCCNLPSGPNFHFITPALDVNVGSRIRSQGTFMVQQSYALQALCGPGDVVVDAGANLGAYTVPLAAHVGPKGRVYAFEPFRKLFQLLCANAAVNGLGNVHAVHAALGGTVEHLQLMSPDLSTFNLPSSMAVRNQAYSQAERNWTLYYEPDTLEDVMVITLDSLRLQSLKLFKIDVEDMEAEVVAGATDTLRRLRPWVWAENARLFERGDRSFLDAMIALG